MPSILKKTLPKIKKDGSKSSIASTENQVSEAPKTLRFTNQPANQSYALQQARNHIKEFMTDSQKSFILLREGKIFYDSGDYRGAIECFNEGISFTPSVSLFNMRAQCHKQLEMFTEAYFDYSFNIRIEPEVSQHFCNRGLVLAKLKKLNLAIEDLDSSINLEPNANNYYSRGTIYSDFGEYENAIEDFTVALADEAITNLLEFKLKCLYRRALCYFDIKKFDEAIKDCQDLLRIDVNNILARSLLGRAYKVLFQYQKAEEQLCDAIYLDKTQANLYIELGDIRFRTGQKNKIIEAIYDFDKAIKLLENKLFNKHGSELILKQSQFHTQASSQLHPTGGSQSYRGSRSVSVKATISNSKSSMSIIKRKESVDENDEEDWGDLDEDEANARLSKTINAFSHPQSPPTNKSSTPQFNIRSSEFGHPTGSSAFKKELEEQIADAYYKRAQAKLLIESDAVYIEAALADSLKSISYFSEDDDYHLVAAICYIRLYKYDDAKKILESILERSPNNYKALYNLAFCKRAEGSQKDAIEGLTKIISYSQAEMATITATTISVPIHRVYEMRGTLFHEVQAYKLSLLDLGKAIAINPSLARNYYLRGDCHSKLGNYEQALADYDQAELKSFDDQCSLLMSRGNVRRLIGNHEGAYKDFYLAYQKLPRDDVVDKVRALSFCAFCSIDMGYYEEAINNLIIALGMNSAFVNEKLDKSNGLKRSELDPELQSDLLYGKRTNWILYYHYALSCYMLKQFDKAHELMSICLSEENKKFIPDDLSRGILLFFDGESLLRLGFHQEALEQFLLCTQTHWIDNGENKFLSSFAIAKCYQGLGLNSEALEAFNFVLQQRPDNPHCLFRRAWTYKALGNYVAAGDDFEKSKSLQPNDPNFAIDYKRISKCEYMILESEPDLIEPFPALLPVPGMQTRN